MSKPFGRAPQTAVVQYSQREAPRPEPRPASRMYVASSGAEKAIILSGCGLSTLGCFAPLITLPFIGSVSYVANGRGDGMIVLGLAALAAVLVFAGKAHWSRFAGIAQLLTIGFTFGLLQLKLTEMRQAAEAELAGNPFRGLADALMGSVGFSWGWIPLVAGAVAVAFHQQIARVFD